MFTDADMRKYMKQKAPMWGLLRFREMADRARIFRGFPCCASQSNIFDKHKYIIYT